MVKPPKGHVLGRFPSQISDEPTRKKSEVKAMKSLRGTPFPGKISRRLLAQYDQICVESTRWGGGEMVDAADLKSAELLLRSNLVPLAHFVTYLRQN